MSDLPKKGVAVTDIDLLRKQLSAGYLAGDAMSTLKWLLEQYNILESVYTRNVDYQY